MKRRLKKNIIATALLLVIIAVPGWFYRYKINYFICVQAVKHIERKIGSDITYTSITADLGSMSLRNMTAVSEDYKVSAKTVEIEYDWSILWRRHKMRYLKAIAVDDFNVVLKEDLSKQFETDDSGAEAKKRKRKLVINEILGHFNTLVSLNRGRIVFNMGGIANTVEIEQACLSRSENDNSLAFSLSTSSGGVVRNGSIEGTFQPSMPGFFKASASMSMFLYDNQWHWQSIDIDGKWDMEGVLSLALDASAGDASIIASYETNFIEDDLSVLDVNASKITLTRLPAANQVYLGESLMKVLGENADKILTRNQITGTFGSDLSVVWNPLSEAPEFDLTIAVNDADMTYHNFPYSLKSLNGFVRIDNSRLKVDLKTTSSHVVDVKVSAGLRGGDGIDVRVTSPFLPADNKLYQAIGDVGQVVWLSFAPTGNVSIDYHLVVTDDDGKFRLEIIPLGGSICYEEFIYPLYDLSGTLIITDDEILLENMTGSHGKGKVVLNGKIEGQGRSDMKVDLHFACTEVALDKLFFGALPAQVRDGLSGIEVVGGVSNMKVDVTGSGRRGLSYFVDVDAAVDALTYIPHKVTFDNARVKAVFEDDGVVLNSVSGLLNGQAVELEGVIAADPNSTQMTYDIKFKARDAVFEKLAAVFDEALPKAARLTGIVDASGYIKGQAGGQENFGASVVCKSSEFELVDYGIRLDDVNGTIDISKLDVKYDITAKLTDSENCKVISKGELNAADLSEGIMNVEIKGAKSSDGFLPAELMLAAGGDIDLRLDNLKMSGGAVSCDKVLLSLVNLGFEGDAVSKLNGNVYCSMTFEGDRGLVVSNARLNIDSARVFERPVERVIANFKYDAQDGFRISNDLTAKLCGGDAGGSFKFKPNGGSGSYELSLDFYDVDVNKFLSAGSDDVLKTQFDLDGRASGQLYFKGIIGDKLSRIGRFGFEIKNIKVTDKTLTDKILDAILDKDSAHTMQRLQVDAYLRQDKIQIEEVNMLLPLMAMKGSGLIDLPTRNITLVLTAQGLGADIKNPFSDLSFFKAIGKTIAKVEVSGDIMDPKVEVTTLGLLKR